jgi:hypothetical protein
MRRPAADGQQALIIGRSFFAARDQAGHGARVGNQRLVRSHLPSICQVHSLVVNHVGRNCCETTSCSGPAHSAAVE